LCAPGWQSLLYCGIGFPPLGEQDHPAGIPVKPMMQAQVGQTIIAGRTATAAKHHTIPGCQEAPDRSVQAVPGGQEAAFGG
jgi:hypothetical protein